jgi:hypothetical protein
MYCTDNWILRNEYTMKKKWTGTERRGDVSCVAVSILDANPSTFLGKRQSGLASVVRTIQTHDMSPVA